MRKSQPAGEVTSVVVVTVDCEPLPRHSERKARCRSPGAIDRLLPDGWMFLGRFGAVARSRAEPGAAPKRGDTPRGGIAAVIDWIMREAQSQDPRQDRVILENPEVREELDRILLTKYLPPIKEQLEKTGYPFSTYDEMDLMTTFHGLGFSRGLVFLLNDHTDYQFFRGEISCSAGGYFLEKSLSLGLPKETDPAFLFRIMRDERLCGMPPTLTVQESSAFPERSTYFHLGLECGSGYEFGPYSLYTAAQGDIEAAIRDSTALYEIAVVEGFSSLQDVERFLEVCYRSYEAC